jgi:hypothetical protein
MKHILFMILTGLILGQLVSTTFDTKVYKIIDYVYKPTWRRPFKFYITLLNQYGGIEICGNKVIKDLYFHNKSYSDYECYYRIFNLNTKII